MTPEKIVSPLPFAAAQCFDRVLRVLGDRIQFEDDDDQDAASYDASKVIEEHMTAIMEYTHKGIRGGA